MADKTASTTPRVPRKRFVGRQTESGRSPVVAVHAQPKGAGDDARDPLLDAAVAHLLPSNYNFEVHKSVAQIRRNGAQRVALQLPEGLAMYACSLVDVLERFAQCECVIMGDVTYGACCIDDYSARALGCDMMIHYGHSCLVPVDTTTTKTLYVFVEIAVDRTHLAQTVRLNFPHCIPAPAATAAATGTSPSSDRKGKGPELEIAIEPPRACSAGGDACCGGKCACSSGSRPHQAATDAGPAAGGSSASPPPARTKTKLAVVGTIQFVAAVQGLKADLEAEEAQHAHRLAIEAAESTTTGGSSAELGEASKDEAASGTVPGTAGGELARAEFELVVPQVKPLSPGEILGCTAPRLEPDVDALLYVGDGRFHLESIMIANPLVPAFRYDPYTKRLTRELYDHAEMRAMRGIAVAQAKESLLENGRTEREQDREAWAVVLGTLGRQGNLRVLKSVTRHLEAPPGRSEDPAAAAGKATVTPGSTPSPHASTPFIPILLSELSPAKLSLLRGVSTFVQTSCPRLSIDWGYAFPKPLLSPYEASVALGVARARGWDAMASAPQVKNRGEAFVRGLENGRKSGEDYPMDFYADGSLGEWTPRFGMGVRKAGGEKGRPVPRRKRQQAEAAAAAAAAAAEGAQPRAVPVA